MTPLDKLRLGVAGVIVLLWVTTLFSFSPTNDARQVVQVLMLIVAGWLFGPAIAGRARGKDDD